MKPKKGKFPAVTRLLMALEQAIVVMLFFSLLGLTLTQILLRNIFDSGLVWADDAIKVLVLWVAMTGALYATRGARHISIDVVTRFLPLASARLIRRSLFLFTAAICVTAAWSSFQFVLLELEDPTPAFLQVPTWFTQAIIPLVLSLMALRFVWVSIFLPEEIEPEHS